MKYLCTEIKGTFSYKSKIFRTDTNRDFSVPELNHFQSKWKFPLQDIIFTHHSEISTPHWNSLVSKWNCLHWSGFFLYNKVLQICSCVLTAGTRTACSCKVEEGRDRIGWLVNPPNLITPDCDTPRGSASHGLFPGALWLETYNPTTFSWAWILGSPAHV